MKKILLASLATAVLAITTLAQAQKDPTVGGAEMYPTKTIIENAVNSPIHKTLVAAVKAGGSQRIAPDPMGPPIKWWRSASARLGPQASSGNGVPQESPYPARTPI